ncbi:MAG: PHP domain-containing protein [Candidatus Nanopelagicales bacterium]
METTDSAARARAIAALGETAFLLERAHAESQRTQAFRRAQGVIAALPPAEFAARLAAGTLQELPGIGKTTGELIRAAGRGEQPEYLVNARAAAGPDAGAGEAIVAALRGDLHAHSDWSDGGSPIAEMAQTARALGHDYLALTDHSPRLTVAHGLTRERLERQLAVVEELNGRWDDFRILTGIEVDILDDGALDQDQDLLESLDIVVASVHSKLRMPSGEMTPRMVAAIANPATTILGHCTGRMTSGRGDRRRIRPPSEFEADVVFEACRQFGVAVEINCRPERRDPPQALMALALEIGCDFSIDTDAHAPGQLAWLPFGAARAAEVGVPIERIINARLVDQLGA